MKRSGHRVASLFVALAFAAFLSGCMTSTFQKSWTEEKNADGSVRTINSESVTQQRTSGKLQLEKIKVD